MKIGLLGGTFDPIHIGHLIIAEEVRLCLKLDHVFFIPAGQPWLKGNSVISEARHRVTMTSLAIASNSYFKLSTVEIDHPGPSYTVNTIKTLQTQFNSAARLFLILGWDSLNELPLWKEPDKVVSICQLAVVPRLNYPKPDLKSLDKTISGIASNTLMLDIMTIDISSSEIRRRVAEGVSIRYLVPQEVEKYIAKNRLYR